MNIRVFLILLLGLSVGFVGCKDDHDHDHGHDHDHSLDHGDHDEYLHHREGASSADRCGNRLHLRLHGCGGTLNSNCLGLMKNNRSLVSNWLVNTT